MPHRLYRSAAILHSTLVQKDMAGTSIACLLNAPQLQAGADDIITLHLGYQQLDVNPLRMILSLNEPTDLTHDADIGNSRLRDGSGLGEAFHTSSERTQPIGRRG